MLTRLKVEGFKNLSGLDVQFGPFTCIAGPNGVGKSNFFDALAFLAALADKPLIDAALSVRGGDGRGGDVRNLFRRVGDRMVDQMSFLVEMVIPATGEDALGQRAEASMTYLQYELELRYRAEAAGRPLGGLEIVLERLVHINRGDAKAHLGFKHSKAWRESTVRGRRTSPYISTENEHSAIVSLHADSVGGTGGGRPRRVHASSLPRTMLSSVNNAAEHRTLVLARQEMMSWTQLQLEPSALRAADNFTAPHNVGANGSHLPATLYNLALLAKQKEAGGSENFFARIANRLAELIENVYSIDVDIDEKRQQLNIVMTDLQHTRHLAGSLSDGTLRFLALTVMESDPSPRTLLCMEEPENGMHPSRIPAMLRLLQDLAVDPEEPIGLDNPLRQVIVNTHSPYVVAQIPDHALLVAQATQQRVEELLSAGLTLLPLPDTWRTSLNIGLKTVPRGILLDYLNPLRRDETDLEQEPSVVNDRVLFRRSQAIRRVMDRADLQLSWNFPNSGTKSD